MGRLSGPVRDRIDLAVDVPPVEFAALSSAHHGETTATVRARVAEARALQIQRQGVANARLTGEAVRVLDRESGVRPLLARAVDRFGLSARAVDRVLRVARTIADLEGGSPVTRAHVAEALQFRLQGREGLC